jgi:hypothetical protein
VVRYVIDAHKGRGGCVTVYVVSELTNLLRGVGWGDGAVLREVVSESILSWVAEKRSSPRVSHVMLLFPRSSGWISRVNSDCSL